MAEVVAPEFARVVRSQLSPADIAQPRAEGQVGKVVLISPNDAAKLLPVAARQASGFFRPTPRKEVIWVEGESELAVDLDGVRAQFSDGLIVVALRVRCDQTGAVDVQVNFACGTRERPAGLYASALRRPFGPELIVSAWGDALVAFAWQCLMGVVTGVANATGKDVRGNLLVPVEMVVSARGIEVVPMARHRFSGSSGLVTKARR